MARPLRIEYEGAFYHITSRGNNKQTIFFLRENYRKFKSYLLKAIQKYNILVHSYVLMSNHYHLIIETPKANLSKAMHYINSSYSNYVNFRHDRCGHFFQGRYKSILIDSDNYLLELSRYMHLNPIRAKIVTRPEDYAHSSYRAYISSMKDRLVYCDVILGMIDNNTPRAKRRYKDFVEKEIGKESINPLQKVKAGAILGDDAFVKQALRKTNENFLEKTEVSNRKKLTTILSAEDSIDMLCNHLQISKTTLLKKKNKEYRNIAMYIMKKYTGLSNRQIGSVFGNISYSAVAKSNHRFSKKLSKEKELQKTIEDILIKMSNVKG